MCSITTVEPSAGPPGAAAEGGGDPAPGTTIVRPMVFAVGVLAVVLGLFLGFAGVSANGVGCGSAASPTDPFPSRVPYSGLGDSRDARALDENVARSLVPQQARFAW